MDIIKEMKNDSKNFINKYYKYIRFLIIIMLFFFSSLFQIIPILIFNIDLNNINVFQQSLLSIFSVIMSLICTFLLYKDELIKDFKILFKVKRNKLMVMFDHTFRYWLIGLSIMIISNILISKLGISNASNDIAVRNNLKDSPIIYGISTLLLVPIFEESVFRLAFKDVFKGKWLFILLSGLIFGSIHVLFNLSNFYQLLYLVPYCSLGLAFSYSYYESNNIYISFIFHILHNTLIAFSMFIIVGN